MAVEHAGGGEQQRAGADGGGDAARRVALGDRGGELATLGLRPGAVRRAVEPAAAGDEQQVGTFRERAVGVDDEAVVGAHLARALERDE